MSVNNITEITPVIMRDLFADYLAQAFQCSQVASIAADASTLTTPDAVLVLDTVADDWRDQMPRITPLRRFLDQCPVAVITHNSGNKRTPNDLRLQLESQAFKVAFTGWLSGQSAGSPQNKLIAVVENNSAPERRESRSDFQVVAFMPVYNEADIIDQSIRYLVEQGIDVYLIDNWSTDSTFDQARSWLGRGLIGLERFPSDGPRERYEWRQILTRIEELSGTIEADWFILHDCDERRHSPWPGLSYRNGLFHADRSGFDCVDHVVLNFFPTEEEFDPQRDVQEQIKCCSFSDHPGHFHQRKAWKNLRRPIQLAATAGHDVTYEGRRVYPFKFLLKHFPIRSQAQGERKLFRDRMPRWSPSERALGWHAQYDSITPGHRFLSDGTGLFHIDESAFAERFLIQRLSGIGVFEHPPSWATFPIAGNLPHQIEVPRNDAEE